ncbi:hypothetical protein [Herbiconiux liangxiaofengii]|uniref:hypothetical protein n=1 Tax=Herbiconiux liangxiaofengii TaxID=3342795 RepID=UPI0035B95351
MFIAGNHDAHWNLALCVSYRRDKRGVLHLVFPVDGGNVTVGPEHPHYRQVEQYLLGATLAPDSRGPQI